MRMASLWSPFKFKRLIRILKDTIRNTSAFERDNVLEYTTNPFEEKLSKKRVTFREGHTCYLIPNCPLSKSTSLTTNLYVNKVTGMFMCAECKKSGDWNLLMRMLSLERSLGWEKKLATLKHQCSPCFSQSTEWKELSGNCRLLHKLNKNEMSSVLVKFNLPKLPKGISEKLSIHVNNDESALYFPLHSLNSTVVGYKMLKKSGEITTYPNRDCPGFLSLESDKKEQAVIVSSLHEFLALASVYKGNIFCVPYENLNLPLEALPVLEDYNKLVLWFEFNANSCGAVKTIGRKLGFSRCDLIRPDEKNNSIKGAVENGEEIKDIIDKSKPMIHEMVTTFKALKEDVFAELANHTVVCGIQWKRFPILNKLLKGHRRGELTILSGPTGCGKTTFASEYSLDLAMQGVNTLWGSFEMKITRLASIMLQQYAQLPLENNLPKFQKISSDFEKLPLFFLKFHGQHDVFKVIEPILQCTYVNDIGHVIIDNVQFMIGVSNQESKFMDRFWKQDLVIQIFREFATKHNCHVTLIMHPRKETLEDLSLNSIFGGAKATQEADNVLILQDRKINSVVGKKYLQICKNRYAGDQGLMVLDFDKASRTFSKKNMQTIVKQE